MGTGISVNLPHIQLLLIKYFSILGYVNNHDGIKVKLYDYLGGKMVIMYVAASACGNQLVHSTPLKNQ